MNPRTAWRPRARAGHPERGGATWTPTASTRSWPPSRAGSWMSYGDSRVPPGGTDRHARALRPALHPARDAGAHRVLKSDGGTIGGTALGRPGRRPPPPRGRGPRVRGRPQGRPPPPGARPSRRPPEDHAREPAGARRCRPVRGKPPGRTTQSRRAPAPAAAAWPVPRRRAWPVRVAAALALRSLGAEVVGADRRAGARGAARGSSRRPGWRCTPERPASELLGRRRWSRAGRAGGGAGVVAAREAGIGGARRGARLAAGAQREHRGHRIEREDDDGRAARSLTPPPAFPRWWSATSARR